MWFFQSLNEKREGLSTPRLSFLLPWAPFNNFTSSPIVSLGLPSLITFHCFVALATGLLAHLPLQSTQSRVWFPLLGKKNFWHQRNSKPRRKVGKNSSMTILSSQANRCVASSRASFDKVRPDCHCPPCLPTGVDVFIAECASGSNRSIAGPPERESDGQTHRRRFRQCVSLDRFQRRRGWRRCGDAPEGQAGRELELPNSIAKLNFSHELGSPWAHASWLSWLLVSCASRLLLLKVSWPRKRLSFHFCLVVPICLSLPSPHFLLNPPPPAYSIEGLSLLQ